MHRVEDTIVDTSTGVNLFKGPVGDTPGTTVKSTWLNSLQEEKQNVIYKAGLPTLTRVHDTMDQLWIAMKRIVMFYDYIVHDPISFRNLFTRRSANSYEINRDYRRVFFQNYSGGYDFSVVLSDGDTWGDIYTGACEQIKFTNGAFIDFGDNPGNLTVETYGCQVENVWIRGTGTTAAAVTESFSLDAENVSFNNCRTSDRISNVEFVAFRGSSTDKYNRTARYINCSIYDIGDGSTSTRIRGWDYGHQLINPVEYNYQSIGSFYWTPTDERRMIGGLATRNWTYRTAATSAVWRDIAWSPKLSIFCAVGTSVVMTSKDGMTWSAQTAAAGNTWAAVCWAAGLDLFVSSALSGVGNRIMTSPDGITWTSRVSAEDNLWYHICYSPELTTLVATATNGTNRVMKSSDGITWSAVSVTASNWGGVVWSAELGLFCSVANSPATGVDDAVMTSPDGDTWTDRTAASTNSWWGLDWSPEIFLFVSVAQSGAGDRIMTSPDGISWTSRTSPADPQWADVVWSPQGNIFAACGANSAVNLIMTSLDGTNWAVNGSAPIQNWGALAWSPGLGCFASVNGSGTAAQQVMTSTILGKSAITT